MRYWMLIGLLFSSSLWAQDIDQSEDRKAGVAHFQDSRYGYAAANLMHLNLDYDNYELTPTGLGLRLGGMVDENWGVELRLATAPSGDTRQQRRGGQQLAALTPAATRRITPWIMSAHCWPRASGPWMLRC